MSAVPKPEERRTRARDDADNVYTQVLVKLAVLRRAVATRVIRPLRVIDSPDASGDSRAP